MTRTMLPTALLVAIITLIGCDGPLSADPETLAGAPTASDPTSSEPTTEAPIGESDEPAVGGDNTDGYSGGLGVALIKDAASNDHLEVWMKALASIGVPYVFVFEDAGAPSAFNLNQVDTNVLLDADGMPLYRLVAHAGGEDLLDAATAANIRDFVAAGGNYFGVCMGAWNAASGYYYDGNLPNNAGVGLIGWSDDGGADGSGRYSVHGFALEVSTLGGLNLANHPINSDLAYTTVDGVRYAGSGYWEPSLPGFWSETDWNRDIRVVAENRGFAESVGGYADFGQRVNNTPAVVEYVPPVAGFGRVLTSTTHPEHNPLAQPYFLELIEYALWGETKTDPSGNAPPVAAFEVSTTASDGSVPIAFTASSVSDPDGDAVTVQWLRDKRVLSNNLNYQVPLEFDGIASSEDLGSLAVKPYRILMRAEDSGSPARIAERSRMIAINDTSGSDGATLDFALSASVATGPAPLSVTFTAKDLSGDGRRSGGDTWFDFGDGEYVANLDWTVAEISRTAVYLAPGTYYASVAVADDDSTAQWVVRTVEIVVE